MNQYMEFYKLLGEFYNEEDITVDSPMSEHIYFRVGGPADILVTPVNEEQVVNTLKLCREYNVPYFILGNGSNILVKDGGISGVVIKFNKLWTFVPFLSWKGKTQGKLRWSQKAGVKLDTTWIFFSVCAPANPFRDWGKGECFFSFAYGGIPSLCSLLALRP